ncbi:MAG: site-specific integrase [Erysipelotrichaceae bacterium]|nr:site-specific integrase [Erysipelotrichaceae bacterium]
MSVEKSTPTKDGKCWVFRCRYKNILGETKSYRSGRFKTKKEAQEAEVTFKLKLTDKCNYNDLTFKDLYNKYYDYQKDKVKNTTMHSYTARYKYLELLNKVKLSDLNYSHFELWKREMRKTSLSDSYLNDVLKLFKILLNFAMKWYGFNYNSLYSRITGFTDPNAPVKDEMKFFTYDEFTAFINAEDTLLFKCAFQLLYYCGLRRGELLGLTWNNIDLFNKKLSIKNNLVQDYSSGGYIITSPKTKHSIRTIPMPDVLIDNLKELKRKNQNVYNFKDNWFVLGYDKPMTFSRLRDRKNLICDKAGVKRIRLHDFRHSCASLLISKGANITLVARFLGHSKIEETLNTYSHFFKSDLDNLVSTINELNQENQNSFLNIF